MAEIVQRGSASGSGGGSVTSNVQRYADGSAWPSFWISRRPAHTALLRGCQRVLVVEKVTDDPETIYWQASGEALPSFRRTGQAVGFACDVPAPSPGAYVEAFINHGATTIGEGRGAGSGRRWLSVAASVPASAPILQMGARLHGRVGTRFVLGEFTRGAAGGPLADGAFSTPRGQVVMALASISPWIGADYVIPVRADPPVVPVATNFVCDVEQMSDGVIGEGVSYWMGLLEGQGPMAEASGSHCVGPPIVFNPILHQVIDPTGHDGAPDYYAFAAGNFVCRGGRLVVYGAGGTRWRYVSWDIHGFMLFAGP